MKRGKSKNSKKTKNLFSIFIRYIILVAVSLPNLWIFYFIFTPLTVYSVFFLLKIFFPITLIGNTLLILNHFSVQLIEACIAGSAYYLLLILNLSTPKIKLNTRIKLIVLSFLSFLVINIIRIFIMSLILISGSSFFNTLHILFWYLGSIVFIVAIWFIEARIFRIKEIPFYSDFKNLLSLFRF